jgi:predicted cupin superfamily sugar epimerase
VSLPPSAAQLIETLQLRPLPREGGYYRGPDGLAGQTPQVLVPAGVWQGSVLRPGGRYALLGTTMAPGFAFADYEAGDARQLTASYPTFARWIERLCPH